MKSIIIAAISTATIFLSYSATVVVGFTFQSVVSGQQQRSSSSYAKFSPTLMRTSNAVLSTTTTLASTTTKQQQSLFDNFDYNSHWYPVVWSQDVPLNQPIRVTVSRYAASSPHDFLQILGALFILTCLRLLIIFYFHTHSYLMLITCWLRQHYTTIVRRKRMRMTSMHLWQWLINVRTKK